MPEIISAPNPVLSKKAPPYVFKKKLSAGRQDDSFLSSFLKKMEHALQNAEDPKGVGLAAPQIGESLSIFITKPSEKAKLNVFINPKIIEIAPPLPGEKKKRRIKKLEGCLSLQNIWGEVLRAPTVTITYLDQSGKEHKKKFLGFMATIVQHEIDHLNGILFPKRVLEQKGILYKSHKNEKGEDEFDELVI